ncbi:MAG: DUF5320 domain-containing protein [Candidatus Gracilibacteria bacterium]|nr:DUF5320 domain-containing protein [Candidatus Gracilibacteria bacterium]
MPNRDRTGPNGQGSKTGRGMGECINNIDDTSENELLEKIHCCKDNKEATFGKRDRTGYGIGRGAGKNGNGIRCCGR